MPSSAWADILSRAEIEIQRRGVGGKDAGSSSRYEALVA